MTIHSGEGQDRRVHSVMHPHTPCCALSHVLHFVLNGLAARNRTYTALQTCSIVPAHTPLHDHVPCLPTLCRWRFSCYAQVSPEKLWPRHCTRARSAAAVAGAVCSRATGFAGPCAMASVASGWSPSLQAPPSAGHGGARRRGQTGWRWMATPGSVGARLMMSRAPPNSTAPIRRICVIPLVTTADEAMAHDAVIRHLAVRGKRARARPRFLWTSLYGYSIRSASFGLLLPPS